MQIEIIFKKGERAGESQQFSPPGIFIGSEPDNDIQFSSKDISPYHSEIFFKENNWYLKEKESSGDTKINGKIISETTLLKSGDLIHITAEAFQVKFEKEDSVIPIKIRPPREKKRHVEIIDDEEVNETPSRILEKRSRPSKSAEIDAERAKRRLVNRMVQAEFTAKKKRLSRVIIFIAVIVNAVILLWWLSKQGIDFEYIRKIILKE